MAQGVCRATGSDVGLGITGVAGPDDQEGVAPGTIFVGSSRSMPSKLSVPSSGMTWMPSSYSRNALPSLRVPPIDVPVLLEDLEDTWHAPRFRFDHRVAIFRQHPRQVID